MVKESKTIHYLPHTHWDREWYRSSNAFRIRLTYVFDKVIQLLEEDGELAYFTFDGQVAALEDYLAIKPEMRGRIQSLVREKRLFVGPWYTQPDLFLTSNESILRNLIIGSRYAKDLGHCMEVGWIPDAFGQIAATPQIFSELGMKAVFTWRGFDYEMLDDAIFLWQGPDNSKLLTIHFPLGYGHYRYLPTDSAEATDEVMTIAHQLEQHSKDGELLFMGGSDHAMPQSGVERILEQVNEQIHAKGYHIEQSNPEKYVLDVLEALKKQSRELMVFKGEARSASLGRIHAGISSTRMDIKNAMRQYETLLPRVCEPLTVMATLTGGSCDQRLINYFWKILFKNSFHDSIYSSSPESVNQSVENRLLDLRHGLNELIWLQFRYLKDQLDLSGVKPEEDLVILYNTLPTQREDLVLVNLFTKGAFSLKTLDGKAIPFAKRSHLEAINTEIEDYKGLLHLNDPFEVEQGNLEQTQIVISGKYLPAMGYLAIKVCPELREVAEKDDTDLQVSKNAAENKYLKLTLAADGSLEVYHKASKKRFTNFFYFEEKGDSGDEYNYSPPKKDQVFTTKDTLAEIELIESNALEVIYKVVHNMEVPVLTTTEKRATEKTMLTIESRISLRSESELLMFETKVVNRSDDHILRVIFQDSKENRYNVSEGHFGQVKRSNTIEKEDIAGATEIELPIYPMNRYVHLDGESTMALISAGPMEYEIYDNRKIALTLLRSVGKLGKSDLAIRPGRASGYHLPTPSSQLHQEVISRYGIIFGENLTPAHLARIADQVTVPIQSRQLKELTRKENQGLPSQKGFLTLPSGLELLTFKNSEDNQGYILRLLNVSGERLKSEFSLSDCFAKVSQVTLLEEEQKILPVEDGNVQLPEMEKDSFITLRLTV